MAGRQRRLAARWKVLFAFAAVLCAATPALAQMAPYKARYKAIVNRVANLDGNGNLTLSLSRDCRSWRYEETLTLNLVVGRRPAASATTMLQVEETLDGRSMRYTSSLLANGQRSNFAGSGRAAGAGRAGQIDLAQDGMARAVTIPDGVYFTVGAMKRVLEELQAGSRSFVLRSFDATGLKQQVEEDRYQVVASPFVNRVLAGDSSGLLAGEPWVVRSTRVMEGKETVQLLELYPSGVASRVLQSINGVSVLFTLQQLQALPATAC